LNEFNEKIKDEIISYLKNRKLNEMLLFN